MKTLRPALLSLLMITLAGLGVPASFGQGKSTSKTAAKKRTTSKASATSTKSSASAGKKTSAKKSSGKRSSARSRRQPGQKAPTSDRIVEIQTALAKDGSLQGSPTGKWDDQTVAAMRRFQTSHHLTANGKLDAPSLQRLGLGSQISGVAAPTPPPGTTSRLTSSNSSPAAKEAIPER